MSKKQITPSSDFTSKVMTGVKKRPRKIGAWNLVYFAPIALVVALLVLPMSQNALLNLTNQKYAAVVDAQKDVTLMQSIVAQLSQFELDESQLLADQTEHIYADDTSVIRADGQE